MTSLEAFKRYQLKLNKLDTDDNIDISPGEFVLIYNEVQNKWFEQKFKDITTRYVDDVQLLIEPDYKLKVVRSIDNLSEFQLPDNYFDYIRSYSLCSKENCKDRVLYNNEVKLVNLSLYLKDEYNKPSFEYQETLITLAKDKIQVYKTDFDVDSVFFTYYRYPKQIDIEGYIKIDNTTESTNIDPELPDFMVDEIIDKAVSETQRRYSDIEGFQLSQNREQENK